MVIRDLKNRYVGSLLGIFWSVIHPLTQFVLYYFIFAVVFKIRLGPEYGGTNFALWLIAGLLPWMFFSETVTKGASAVVEQSNLIKKMVFPSEIFPIVSLMAAMVSHLIGTAILIFFLLLSGYGLSSQILLVFPYMLIAIVFALGITWFVSSVNVFLRDVGQVIGVIVNIWFYLTPIVYPGASIPGKLQWLFRLNPMTHVVEGYRMALLGKIGIDVTSLLYILLVTVAILVIGALTFRRLKPIFADVL
jgi:ABC-type polysaccharide/polyol phosphate export permease